MRLTQHRVKLSCHQTGEGVIGGDPGAPRGGLAGRGPALPGHHVGVLLAQAPPHGGLLGAAGRLAGLHVHPAAAGARTVGSGYRTPPSQPPPH